MTSTLSLITNSTDLYVKNRVRVRVLAEVLMDDRAKRHMWDWHSQRSWSHK